MGSVEQVIPRNTRKHFLRTLVKYLISVGGKKKITQYGKMPFGPLVQHQAQTHYWWFELSGEAMTPVFRNSNIWLHTFVFEPPLVPLCEYTLPPSESADWGP